MKNYQRIKQKLWQGIAPNVILLGLVSLITDVSSEIIHPLLPMFIVALGGGGLAVGLIGGLGDSLASILKVFAGFWSDKSGKRKPFVFSGYALSSLCKIFLAFSTVWQHILILKPAERVGKGLRTAPRDAIIADSSIDQRGKAFGLHRAMDTAGAIGGSSLAFLLFYFLGFSYKSIFLLAGLVGVLALIPLLWVKEKRRKPKKSLSLRIGLKGLSKPLRWFIFIAVLFSLADFNYMFFLLRVKEAFVGPKISVALPILFYIWFNIIYSLFSLPVGAISDRTGRKPLLILGYFLFGVTCFGFIWGRSWGHFLILFGLYGLVYALVDGQQRAFVSDLSKKELRGTALGTLHTCIALANLPDGLIAGYLWQYVHPSMVFVYGTGMAFLTAGLFIVLNLKGVFTIKKETKG